MAIKHCPDRVPWISRVWNSSSSLRLRRYRLFLFDFWLSCAFLTFALDTDSSRIPITVGFNPRRFVYYTITLHHNHTYRTLISCHSFFVCFNCIPRYIIIYMLVSVNDTNPSPNLKRLPRMYMALLFGWSEPPTFGKGRQYNKYKPDRTIVTSDRWYKLVIAGIPKRKNWYQ